MKILIAEDDLMIADILEQDLRDQGHEVCGIATTVAGAVALVRLHRPDVAVLDVNLKNGSGADVALHLAESGDLAGLGVLYVTGADREKLDRASGHALLPKPYQMETMGTALAIVMDIVRSGATSRQLPRGMRLLTGS